MEEKKAPEVQKAPAENVTDMQSFREKLSLEQKFVRLRQSVPAIVQRQHSDGVKYKFAKIFDIYELLAPAMNTWGVNFDIVGEEATRHYDNGDPMYYTNYEQQTQRGPRTVWVYEADLTLRWTNADKPEEHEEITLHAIGTNDGGPDKAKGSAWTYCLKYYLFEKFNIDQGEDDPDNKDLSGDGPPSAPQGGQNGRQSTGAGQGNGNGHPQGNGQGNGNARPQGNGGQGGTYTLSEPQMKRLYAKGQAAGHEEDAIRARIKEKYGKDHPNELSRQQYDEICAALDAEAKNGGSHA